MGKVKKKLRKLGRTLFIWTLLFAAIGIVYQASRLQVPRYVGGILLVIGFTLWLLLKLNTTSKKYLNKYGYVVLAKEDELEHRYIAKNVIGRSLKPNEIVHHINGKRDDNDISNLCLMDSEKHEMFHAWLKWKRDKDGRYPNPSYQKHMLVKQYQGTLLENHVPKTRFAQDLDEPTFVRNRRRELAYTEKNKFNEFDGLFKQLKAERRKIAIKREIPAYLIFQDRTLRDFSRILPDSPEKMLRIKGVGPENFRLYGGHFLSVIQEFKSKQAAARKGTA